MPTKYISTMLVFAAIILAIVGYIFNSPKTNSVAIVIIAVAIIISNMGA